MEKYSFLDDYSEGCHPDILAALSKTNLIQQTAYGNDEYSAEAKRLLLAKLNDPEADIFFVAGGTLANIVVSSAILKSHEAVIAAETGHIVTRETGAIEATGHKIISIRSKDGKVDASDLQMALDSHAHVPHMVKPNVVYISNASEIGTIYRKRELQSLHSFCREKGLILFLDGARLGTALCSDKNDLTLEDVSKYCDIFSLGATKNGGLMGEAIIISNQELAEDFAFHIKQRGALLAKGRLGGIQFVELFRENLFFELASWANKMSMKISAALIERGYELSTETESNQIFPVLPNSLIENLSDEFAFYIWEKVDEKQSIVRLVTSWATNEQKVDDFIDRL